jgi:hypothetical protein
MQMHHTEHPQVFANNVHMRTCGGGVQAQTIKFLTWRCTPDTLKANFAIHTDEKGQFVSVSLAAARSIKEGDALTFRTDLRHPSDVFLTQGYHDPRHFGPIGVMVPVAWSAAVQNITAAPPRKATDKDDDAYAGVLPDGFVAAVGVVLAWFR